MKLCIHDFLVSMRVIFSFMLFVAGKFLWCFSVCASILAFNIVIPAYVITAIDVDSNMLLAGMVILWLSFSMPVTVSVIYAYLEYRKRKFMANTLSKIQETKVPGEKEKTN